MNQKILIVDDKPANLIALRQTLSVLDVNIISSTDGNDALVQSLNHEFALAILDVQMPGMNGYELAEILRSEPKTAHHPSCSSLRSITKNTTSFVGTRRGRWTSWSSRTTPRSFSTRPGSS